MLSLHGLRAPLASSQPHEARGSRAGDRVDHLSHVGIGGRRAWEKAGLPSLGHAIDKDSLEEDNVVMEVQEKSSITPCRPP